jgi:hypothetical protein
VLKKNKLIKKLKIMHKSTIKSQVKKQFQDVEIIEIKKFKFGMFCVKVKKESKRTTKIHIRRKISTNQKTELF